mmetsp:Transcript_29024/g.33156  ORF Transcript_29024/g.33156 Transcript_29024/m.33156 type:complete len:100 (+) Transcript_29024:773-1072(+)
MLKKILVKNQLNNPYFGGLGSFSLFLMLYSSYFLERLSSYDSFHVEETYPARLFVWFLTYFGEFYNYEISAITFDTSSYPVVVPKIYCGVDHMSDLKVL